VFRIGEDYYELGTQYEAAPSEAEVSEYKHCSGKATGVWERIIEEMGETDMAVHAYYFSAICYKRMGEVEKALQFYEMVADGWPDYEWAGVANYMIARIYRTWWIKGIVTREEANRVIEARCTAVVERYPNGPFVRAAQSMLDYLIRGELR